MGGISAPENAKKYLVCIESVLNDIYRSLTENSLFIVEIIIKKHIETVLILYFLQYGRYIVIMFWLMPSGSFTQALDFCSKRFIGMY